MSDPLREALLALVEQWESDELDAADAWAVTRDLLTVYPEPRGTFLPADILARQHPKVSVP